MLADLPGLFIVTVGTMFAATFTAIAPLEVIHFGKHNVAFGTSVKILGFQLIAFASGRIRKLVTHVAKLFIIYRK